MCTVPPSFFYSVIYVFVNFCVLFFCFTQAVFATLSFLRRQLSALEHNLHLEQEQVHLAASSRYFLSSLIFQWVVISCGFWASLGRLTPGALYRLARAVQLHHFSNNSSHSSLVSTPRTISAYLLMKVLSACTAPKVSLCLSYHCVHFYYSSSLTQDKNLACLCTSRFSFRFSSLMI